MVLGTQSSGETDMLLAISDAPITSKGNFSSGKSFSIIFSFEQFEEHLADATYFNEPENNYFFQTDHLFPVSKNPNGGKIVVAKNNNSYAIIFDLTLNGEEYITGTVYGEFETSEI
jgi:hypothetical protein